MNSGMNAFNSNPTGGFSAAATPADVALAQGMNIDTAMSKAGNLPFNEIMRQRAIADQRARFGAEGAGSLGTGAQFAEATMNADLTARNQQEQFNRALNLMGQDLNERSTGANVGLQNRGQNIQTAIANMQGGIQGAANANSARNSMFNSMAGLSGQAR